MFSRYANGVRDDERWTSLRFHADGVGAKRINSTLAGHPTSD